MNLIGSSELIGLFQTRAPFYTLYVQLCPTLLRGASGITREGGKDCSGSLPLLITNCWTRAEKNGTS